MITFNLRYIQKKEALLFGNRNKKQEVKYEINFVK